MANVEDHGSAAPSVNESPTTTTVAWGLRYGPSTTVPARFDQTVITYLRDVLHDRITRNPDPFPQFGFLETAGVDPLTLEPIAVAGVGRVADAAGMVVPR